MPQAPAAALEIEQNFNGAKRVEIVFGHEKMLALPRVEPIDITTGA